ncbi:hypothetical protein B0H14DRAFT_3487085 [Mycena olivaceomarginata]|nr:hypothetical protein B0H14DRAFT_3487085 [Mycena olivaceomarginata]
MSSSRCDLPFRPDPGQPNRPLSGQKIYLVSGPDCKNPGAFVSWPSASAEFNRHPTTSIKSYGDWDVVQSAWWAGCDRGDHVHDTGSQVVLSLPRTKKPLGTTTTPVRSVVPPSAVQRSKSVPLPLVEISSRSPSPVRVHASSSRGTRSPKKAATRLPPAEAAASPPGRRVYAIRSRDDLSGGVIFSDYREAQAWYNAEQAAGFAPVMVTGASLMAAVNFTDCFPDVDPDTVRQDFVAEENRARRCRVAADIQRTAYHRGVLESLQDLREDAGAESDHDSDESDVLRSTLSLESELNARLSYGEEWRYYRSNGGDGKA